MAKMTRRRKTVEQKVDYGRRYPISEAVALLKPGKDESKKGNLRRNSLSIIRQKQVEAVLGELAEATGGGVRTFW